MKATKTAEIPGTQDKILYLAEISTKRFRDAIHTLAELNTTPTGTFYLYVQQYPDIGTHLDRLKLLAAPSISPEKWSLILLTLTKAYDLILNIDQTTIPSSIAYEFASVRYFIEIVFFYYISMSIRNKDISQNALPAAYILAAFKKSLQANAIDIADITPHASFTAATGSVSWPQIEHFLTVPQTIGGRDITDCDYATLERWLSLEDRAKQLIRQVQSSEESTTFHLDVRGFIADGHSAYENFHLERYLSIEKAVQFAAYTPINAWFRILAILTACEFKDAMQELAPIHKLIFSDTFSAEPQKTVDYLQAVLTMAKEITTIDPQYPVEIISNLELFVAYYSDRHKQACLILTHVTTAHTVMQSANALQLELLLELVRACTTTMYLNLDPEFGKKKFGIILKLLPTDVLPKLDELVYKLLIITVLSNYEHAMSGFQDICNLLFVRVSRAYPEKMHDFLQALFSAANEKNACKRIISTLTYWLLQHPKAMLPPQATAEVDPARLKLNALQAALEASQNEARVLTSKIDAIKSTFTAESAPPMADKTLLETHLKAIIDKITLLEKALADIEAQSYTLREKSKYESKITKQITPLKDKKETLEQKITEAHGQVQRFIEEDKSTDSQVRDLLSQKTALSQRLETSKIELQHVIQAFATLKETASAEALKKESLCSDLTRTTSLRATLSSTLDQQTELKTDLNRKIASALDAEQTLMSANQTLTTTNKADLDEIALLQQRVAHVRTATLNLHRMNTMNDPSGFQGKFFSAEAEAPPAPTVVAAPTMPAARSSQPNP